MEITTAFNEGVLDMSVEGRLDGYWADHLDQALSAAVRDGHHRIRLDCSKLVFMSSAGIAVLLKFHKELRGLNGSFQVVNPSKTVLSALKLTRLTDLLVERAPGDVPPAAAATATETPAKPFDIDGAAFEVYTLDASARLTCEQIGSPVPLATGSFRAEDCHSLDSRSPVFALGIGAFGDGFADCRDRFGELLSVAGATAYQPSGSGSVADYLLSNGSLTADVQLLYGLACDGRFSHLLRFDVPQRGARLALSKLIDACVTAVGAESVGVVIAAETAGLVGASLRRSPAAPIADGDFFAHPGVRNRLSFTAEPSFEQGVTLAAGVISRARDAANHALLRPMGAAGTMAHVHAAAFRFRPLKKGRVDLRDTVTTLFEPEHLLGVLHLLQDDRGIGSAGESEFVRGACWVAPITGPWAGR